MKTYSIQWTSTDSFGSACVYANNARDALAYIRAVIPNVVIDYFSVNMPV